jgi:transcriptional regulator with PAS, ATPase and Fis domain
MYNIHIPPLRERKKDIPPLARHFLARHANANSKKIDFIGNDLIERLLHYSFPGNVRELENIIAAGVLREKGKQLTLGSTPGLFSYTGPERRKNIELLSLEQLEKRHIERVLELTGGNRPKAAEILGINVSTVYRKIEKYNIGNSS